MKRKGIILAGGSGTRLYPVTHSVSKQLLPVFDKPMIYYPLSTLMLADIKNILIITTKDYVESFKRLLGNGSQWGIDIKYTIQPNPDGLAQAFILAEEFIGDDLSTLILGDNIYYGHNLESILKSAYERKNGATIFVYHVNDPQRYGVAEFNTENKVISLEEKPFKPKSNFAVTGLYFYDQRVVDYAKKLTPSKRGELEITDLNILYLKQDDLYVEMMDRGYTWLDTGTHETLLEAGQFIATIENRQGLKVACPEEISLRKNWISRNDLKIIIKKSSSNSYTNYLNKILGQ